MPSAEIITIGTEILLGEILDTNARYLAQTLRQAGIDLYRKTTIGDNASRIAGAVCEALNRCEIVITTGGLGPTIDDPTREALAQAFDVPLEFHPELWEQIQARFRRFNRQATENNRRQAYLPAGSLAIENPVGTAPSFIIARGDKAVIALPGVPSEMQYLMTNAVLPYLQERYPVQTVIQTRLLHTAGVGESMIDERIADLEALTNPTVGLAAHSGQVDVRITAKADSPAAVQVMIAPLEQELRQRLGDWIYGADADTLEAIAMQAVQRKGWSLVVVEAGLGGELARRLAGAGSAFRGGYVLSERPTPQEMAALVQEFSLQRGAEVGLGAAIYPGSERQEVSLLLISPDGEQQFTRPYGGPPEYAPRWAMHHSLDLIRRL